MTNRIVFVCCCIDDCQGLWSDKDFGTVCSECGAEVTAIDIDAQAEKIKELAEFRRSVAWCVDHLDDSPVSLLANLRSLLKAQEGGE